ncbi:MAG TPA: PEP-CTERM sorting domain-containing protein [Vicinamibacterales bacterium]|jgi:hypothetical protein|nr:PEP-CTERM sorting domain-containing protein [Vicinamibacterales bacterium]
MIRSILTKAFTLTALVAGLVLLPSAKAEAAFTAYICSVQNCSGGTVKFADDNSAADADPTPGAITLVGGSVGGMNVTVNTSQSHPALVQPGMDLTFTASTNTGSPNGDVWFYATDNNFSVIAPLIASISATFLQGGSGTVEAFVYGGVNNNPGQTSPLLGTSGVLSGSNGSTVGTTFAAGFPLVSPYSYTLGLHIIRTGAGSTTGNFGVSGTPIPEPATLSLLGLGLTGIGAAVRRRRKARQNA